MGHLWVKPVAPAMVMKEFMLGQTLQSLEVQLGQAVVLEVMRLLWTQEAYEHHPYGPEITDIVIVVGDGRLLRRWHTCLLP